MKNALIIFTRNPVLGQCKTRLAKSTGDEIALKVYQYLLNHTMSITKTLNADKFLFYSDSISKNDIWNDAIYTKMLQKGDDLGERMKHAFSYLFRLGYKNVMIIGSDILELSSVDIDKGFKFLDHYEAVIGPSKDGGYYLLGLTEMNDNVFVDKSWGTSSVLEDTKSSLQNISLKELRELNDIDTFDDLINSDTYKSNKTIQQLVKHLHD